MHVNSPRDDSRELSSRHRAERYLPLLPIGGAMFMLSALVYFRLRHDSLEVRSPLQVLVAWSYQTFGLAPGILGCVLVLTWGSIWFVNGRCERVGSRLLRIAAMVVLLGVFFNLGADGVSPSFHKGTLGASLAGTIADVLGIYPGIVLVWAMTVASLLLATDFGFREEWERLRANRDAVGEAGVEDEVAEVLKGLGSSSASPAAAARTTAGGPLVGVATPVALDPTVAAASRPAPAAPAEPEVPAGDDDGDVDMQPEVVSAAPAGQYRRRSYFDRRYGVSGEAGEADDEWEPATPENQEIDNPEAAAEVAAVGELAAAPDREQPTDRDDRLAGAEATDDAAADEIESAAAASGLLQLGLFDAPLPAPRAPVGGWIAAAVPADAQSGDQPLAEPVAAPESEHDADDDVLILDDEPATAGVHAGADQPVLAAAGGEAPDEAGEVDLEADFDADLAEDSAEAAADTFGAAVPGRPLRHETQDRDQGGPDASPVAAEPETVVPIPRPAAAPVRAPAAPMFPEPLVAEAIEVVVGSGRASAALLQRKLRLDFAAAEQLLGELARRGIVELGADSAHGRVLR